MAGEEHESRDGAIDAVVAGAAGLVALLHPAIGVVAAGAAPAASSAAKHALALVSRRRQDREERVLERAAAFARLDPGDLERRCDERPDLEELLLFALRAAGDTAVEEKLIAFSLALASGVLNTDGGTQWQRAFVRALQDLGAEELDLLNRFTWTANQLGLGDGGPEFDTVPRELNEAQIDLIGKDLPALRSNLAVLQRHGLVSATAGGGGTYGGGGGHTSWHLSPFGLQVRELLAEIGDALQGRGV